MDLKSNVRLSSGHDMPILGLGTWKLLKDTAGTIEKALELGYRMIDTSGDYGTQPGIGKGLKNSGRPRDSYYIVTKVEEIQDAYRATKRNLEELDIKYADMILIHRPPSSGVGLNLWRGLQKARGEGLVKDIGVSNYSIEQIDELAGKSGEKPTVNQIEWTPFGHSKDMLDYCMENDIVLQAYSPLTRGDRLDNETLAEIAEYHGKTPALVLIRWNLQLGTVPIIKANQPEHLVENINVFDFELTDNEMIKLNGLNEASSELAEKPLYLQ